MSSSTGADSPGTAVVSKGGAPYHVLKIDGFSRIMETNDGMLSIASCLFPAGGHTWQLVCYPMGAGTDNQNVDFIAVFLCLKDAVAVDDAAVIVQATFSLLDQDKKPVPSYSKTTEKVDFSKEIYDGFRQFIGRRELELSGLIKDDCFAVRVDVHLISGSTVNKEEAEAPPPTSASSSSDLLHQHLGDLLWKSRAGADVEFRVGEETFAAHRLLLKARSPVFKAQLLGPPPAAVVVSEEEAATDGGSIIEANDDIVRIITIDDVEPRVFEALLRFIYTDMIPPEITDDDDDENFEMTQSLLVAADEYGIRRLKLICEDRLCGCINTRSVSNLLALAEERQCPGLKAACFDFVSHEGALLAVTGTREYEQLLLARSCGRAITYELLDNVDSRTKADTAGWSQEVQPCVVVPAPRDRGFLGDVIVPVFTWIKTRCRLW